MLPADPQPPGPSTEGGKVHLITSHCSGYLMQAICAGDLGQDPRVSAYQSPCAFPAAAGLNQA